MKPGYAWGLALGLAALVWGMVPDPHMARAGGLAVLALALWLTEAVPPFVPTLVLAASIPLAFPGDARFTLGPVLAAGADPVLVLFLGGMVLAAAARRHGLDQLLAEVFMRRAGSRPVAVLAILMAVTAGLSLWMSNVAAAALMLAVAAPMLPADGALRRGVLLGIACAANLGGMGTPMGSGPNAIAVASLGRQGIEVTFLGWMTMALPITVAALAVAWGLIVVRYGLVRAPAVPLRVQAASWTPGGRWVLAIAALIVLAWLTEAFHGVPMPVVALGGAGLLFSSGLIGPAELRGLDWETLLLIAGGLILGDLLADAGVLRAVGAAVSALGLGAGMQVALLLVLAALGSALMSNTGTATLLIPLGLAVAPDPSTAILIALACSFGFPFVISTPPNAMAVAQGVRSVDLLLPGLVLLVLGIAVLALAGPAWIGVVR